MSNGTYENAQAGPSSPTVFLPQNASQPQSSLLSSTNDLIARFNLLPAYDKYVRSFGYNDPVNQTSAETRQSPSAKGKGKELSRDRVSQRQGKSPENRMDLDEDGESGSKKKKSKEGSYKHLIKGIVGKHSLKKDDYLTTLIQVPPKQKIDIQEFDANTQTQAFFVSLDGLKGYNPHALIQESDQAREDRKRRKEARKAQRSQLSSIATPGTFPATPGQGASSLATPAAGTPGMPYSVPTPALTPVAVQRRPSSDGNPVNGLPTPRFATASPVPNIRGVKRERDGFTAHSPTAMNGSFRSLDRAPKKRRIDHQPQQQPTPLPI
ncbi:hypothetical protein SISNIDRAFT_455827 [Sistotremastrum niveocremeum HHB9708]|uniref:Mediator of RNA polymerase II transcription subunit 19 n=2 Tax=Sistotremastraceae TaxID=3402574 RepID=A0A164TSA8_9AGAM|nr:hypothetical protein SISNIDRAFT_455827 [Sistotremastrum niveocremeum HHB9708]KZT42261.1 hypothetical protein SISSUDRAFT_1041902 [Sistotremastrum suecicum HHB10207 ss-3]